MERGVGGGGGRVGPPPRRSGRASVSAALEDTATALLAGSTLAISETSNPVNACCQAPLPSLGAEITERRRGGNTGAF